MAGGSIKLFQFTQNYCKAIGIRAQRSNRNCGTLNSKNWIFVVCSTQYGIATVAYLLYDAKSMCDYGVIFYTVFSIVLGFLTYFATVWKRKDIQQFTENCEAFIEKRKQILLLKEIQFYFTQND